MVTRIPISIELRDMLSPLRQGDEGYDGLIRRLLEGYQSPGRISRRDVELATQYYDILKEIDTLSKGVQTIDTTDLERADEYYSSLRELEEVRIPHISQDDVDRAQEYRQALEGS